MSQPVNLRELAIDRAAGRSVVRRPRRSFARLLVPLGVLIGFAAVCLWSFRECLVAATPVTVVPVLSIRAEIQEADTPLFRSAGWVEPRPTPVIVSSMIDGIVEQLRVIEGQEIEAGQPVADLVKADAEIGVRQATAELALQRSTLATAEARLSSAETYLKEPIERIAALAAAESDLARTESTEARIPPLLIAAEARVAQAERVFEGKKKAGQAVAAITIAKAESELAIAKANLAELRIQKESVVKERMALVTRRDTLQRQLELKIEERRQLAEALAAIDAARAHIELAQSRLATAELHLWRTTVSAPISGKVLSLAARPGTKLMGFAPGALQDASTVVTMYDPKSLQVRADVRLENVPQLLQGQKVEISTPAVPGKFFGSVVAITSLTDIQKNTLQVKVAIDAPPAVLKPDMLVEALFLAPPTLTSHAGEPPLRLVIPRSLIESSASEAMVWIADRQASCARRRLITVGSAVPGDLVEITAGLNVGDRVIASGREGLQDRQRIQIRTEETTGPAATPVTSSTHH